MTQGERVKELRKTLSLTLEKFGQRSQVFLRTHDKIYLP